MEVKLIDLLNSKPALDVLNGIPFKANHSIIINRAVNAVNVEVKLFHETLDKRKAILLDGVPEGEKPDVDKLQEFNEEMKEATDTILSLNVEPVKFSWFAKSNGAINDDTEWHDFTPAAFQALSWLIFDDCA